MLRQVVFQAEAWQVAKQTADDEGELSPIIRKERRVWAEIIAPLGVSAWKQFLFFARSCMGIVVPDQLVKAVS